MQGNEVDVTPAVRRDGRLLGGLRGWRTVAGVAGRSSDMWQVRSVHNENRHRRTRTGSANSIEFEESPIEP
jgi:hypothetical protein